MRISESLEMGKSESLVEGAQRREAFARPAAGAGVTLHEVEQKTLGAVLQIGARCLEQFLAGQGDGDRGATGTTDDGQTLRRSDAPVARPLRTVFGEHSFAQFVSAAGAKEKIALRPLDARRGLPAGKASYWLEEFAQYFGIEPAFGPASLAFAKGWGQTLPVDSRERRNRRIGAQAEEYRNALPTPPPQEEGALLVTTSDGQGVPLIRTDAEPRPAFCHRERPGNRRRATRASVYAVDREVRSAEAIVAALFRDPRDEAQDPERPARPQPAHQHVVARFAATELDGGCAVPLPGPSVAWSWAADEVRRRRRTGQPLLRRCDGQESLWAAAAACADPVDADATEILDVLPVSDYVWLAARAWHPQDDPAARKFPRERLLRILRGEVAGGISGLRRRATDRGLRGPPDATCKPPSATSSTTRPGCATRKTSRRATRSRPV